MPSSLTNSVKTAALSLSETKSAHNLHGAPVVGTGHQSAEQTDFPWETLTILFIDPLPILKGFPLQSRDLSNSLNCVVIGGSWTGGGGRHMVKEGVKKADGQPGGRSIEHGRRVEPNWSRKEQADFNLLLIREEILKGGGFDPRASGHPPPLRGLVPAERERERERPRSKLSSSNDNNFALYCPVLTSPSSRPTGKGPPPR